MKIKLSVSSSRYSEIQKELQDRGIEVDDEADLILSERDGYLSTIKVRNRATGEYVMVSTEDIIFVETFGHKVVVHAGETTYLASERLYQLCGLLNPEKFLRISNSVLIATDKVKKIQPTLSMKYILTMSDGNNVDVTRSYYNLFRDYYKI